MGEVRELRTDEDPFPKVKVEGTYAPSSGGLGAQGVRSSPGLSTDQPCDPGQVFSFWP